MMCNRITYEEIKSIAFITRNYNGKYLSIYSTHILRDNTYFSERTEY